ncbi:MAG: metallophosphoesterase, partial [Clostridia bacterium]|nr:metallophosphoesterase [Clostridia bacterium]
MALYAIADTHLSLSTDKPMDVFRGWSDYMQRLENQWRALVEPTDTVVIAGDISWGMSLKEALADFRFLNDLPGQKLIFKGNHDYWWTTRRKMDTFLEENGLHTLRIVHNDAVVVGDIAVCGTRGWFYDEEEPDNAKILAREAGRLATSIAAAKQTGATPVVFLHYPPIFDGRECTELLEVLKRENITRCYYGHVHSAGIRVAFQGEWEGIEFRLISGDSLGFCPLHIS